MDESGIVKTEITGLEEVFLGGIPRTNTILVQGAAGTAKTLLGLEFVFRGITPCNEPGIVVVFETNPNKLARDAAQFGWNFESLQRKTSSK